MHDPKDLIPQLDQMRLGVDYRFIIKLRGFALDVRPLTVDETVSMTAEVICELQKLPDHQQNSQYEATLIAKKTLCMASTSAPGKNDPKMTEYILGRNTPEELQFLYNQWVDGTKRCSPAIENMAKAEVDALVADVKKNRDLTLIQLSRSQLCAMVLFLLPTDG
jgi:hypothetical protein